MKFNCNGCGKCCMFVGYAVENARKIPVSERTLKEIEVADFPFDYDDNGRCSQLNEDNTCNVYLTRPDICSVDKTFENHYLGNISIEEYYRKSEEVCKILEKIDSVKSQK